MKRQQIAWWLWAVGTVVIVLSWANLVSPIIGWCGFGIGLVGSVVGWGFRPPRSSTATAHSERKDSDVI